MSKRKHQTINKNSPNMVPSLRLENWSFSLDPRWTPLDPPPNQYPGSSSRLALLLCQLPPHYSQLLTSRMLSLSPFILPFNDTLMVVNQIKRKILYLVLIVIQFAILFDFPAPLTAPLARFLSPLHILTKTKIDKILTILNY